jgi:hypothetical protein
MEYVKAGDIEYIRSSDLTITDASQIEPDKWYSRGCLSNFRFHRGRLMSDALSNDPMAPRTFHPRANISLVKGSDVLEYLASYSDDLISSTVEIKKGIEKGVAEEKRKFDAELNRIMAEEVRYHRESVDAAVTEVMEFVNKNTVDITKAASATCGIYFLKFDGEIVYVGQSRSVYGRISAHKGEGRKKFDKVIFMPCSENDLNDFEGFFINLLRPKYNGGIMDKSYGAPKSKLWGEISEIFI